MKASYTMNDIADVSSPNEALAPVVINTNKLDTRFKVLPTSHAKPRTSIPSMSMANLESAAYRSHASAKSFSTAQSESSNATTPKITHFAPKVKSRTSMLQMAAASADEFVPDM